MIRPHRIIGENYLERWHCIPRNRFFNIYLHRYTGSDDMRAAHDHRWWSVSFLLKGRLKELVQIAPPDKYGRARFVSRSPRWMRPVLRSAEHSHIMQLQSDTAWTLFITGPRIRKWGYWCKDGWMLHSEYDKRGGCG